MKTKARVVHEAIIGQTVTCAAWLAKHDALDLAAQMRQEFLDMTGVTDDEWNEQVDDLLDYAERKGSGDAWFIAAVRV